MAFGKQEGVSYSKLLYWRRSLGEEAAKEKTSGAISGELVPVHVVSDTKATAPQTDSFEVWLANGVALNVAAGFDEAELLRLVSVLSAC